MPIRRQGSPPPIRKERQQVLQLLFIDIQVGSIATGLEVAAGVGKPRWRMECLSAATAEWSAGTQVHSAHQGGSRAG